MKLSLTKTFLIFKLKFFLPPLPLFGKMSHQLLDSGGGGEYLFPVKIFKIPPYLTHTQRYSSSLNLRVIYRDIFPLDNVVKTPDTWHFWKENSCLKISSTVIFLWYVYLFLKCKDKWHFYLFICLFVFKSSSIFKSECHPECA